ncbi:PAS domain S-box [Candidatus Methanoperedens nitroreducens]|uniref:PAS domain S-box n=1 Tax=Candidatus Methanoperedens nitratireducens TaxID=1392998 RepID=A0A062V8W1_9EURY|nr:PAS domain S-box protein [Candidatus Methanoperedens nitroreducens]KCZ72948.1 PAS domain S-box [Candidatus Methanoperedens nitroreducens]MDJ1423107.1 PAS domain S-box protein [Candidatus Methanoperedens sp.]
MIFDVPDYGLYIRSIWTAFFLIFGVLTSMVLARHRRIEEALHNSEQRFRSVAETATDAIISIDRHGNIVFWNKAAENIFGYSAGEAIDKSLTIIMPKRLHREHTEGIKRLISTGESSVVGKLLEMTGLRKDGSEFPLELSIAAWKTGEETFYTGIIRDITERKHAEEELLKFKLGIERSDEVIFITDKEGSITYTNPAFERIYGFSRDEVLGKTPSILKSGVLPQEVYKQFWDTILAKKVVSGEIINKTKDGRLLNTESTANPILNNDGDIVGFLAIQRDITEHKRAEDELKIKAQLLDTATDSIFVHDLDGNFIYLNETAYRSHGYSRDEMMNLKLHSIITPEYSRLVNQRTLDLVEKGEAVFESAHLDKNGSIIPVEVHACIIESGGKKLILCVARDITERKQAERMLKEKARAELYGFIVSALPVFASNVPSQVRNTLIKNFAERFEKNARPGFEEEMKRFGYDQRIGAENTQEILDVLMPWLMELFSNFGIQTRTISEGIKRDIEFLNCPWIDEASGNPIFCFICRAMVIRSFTWTALKGSADQRFSIANGSQTCRFEIHAQSIL